ncbi:MAG: hypothetical protein IKB27_01925 [Clostridia bacterium]|nr:hypothetical protein [Clostridia bacterium]
MKKKLLIAAILAALCMLMLALAVSAEEYTVSTSDEFTEAYDSATDGDTIIITADITADLTFGKSITYILRANWQSKSAGGFSGKETEISIIADGGDYKLSPTDYHANGWIQSYSAVEGKYTLNLAGINGGTMTFDGTNSTIPRLMYVRDALDLTWNLLNGARISGFNLTTSNSDVQARIIHATEFNMYDGSKICGNSIPANSAAFINSTALNIYGGEICHNYSQGNRNWSTDCGFIYVNGNVNMYGGKIYENVINVNMNKTFYGFIDVTSGNTVAFFGGYIGENYASTSGNISAIFGVANENVTYCYFKNQEFGKTLKYSGGSVSLVDGKWVVSDATITEEQLTDPSFNWKGYKGSSDSVIAFFESDSLVVGDVSLSRYKAIEGYIQGVNLKDAWNNNQGTNKTYSLTGSDYSVPATSALWSSTEGDCGNGISSDAVIVGSYYFAVAHVFGEDDHDCSTGDACQNCSYEVLGLAHSFVESLTYKKYTENGTYICDCTNEGCTVMDKNEKTPPIFITSGYSVSEAGSIMQGFAVDREALGEFTRVNGNIITFGMVAGVKGEAYNTLDGKLFNADGTKRNDRVAVVDYTSLNYDVMEMVVSGLNLYPEVEVYCCLYYMVNGNAYYVNETTEADTTTAVSYAVKFPELFEAVVSNEE